MNLIMVFIIGLLKTLTGRPIVTDGKNVYTLDELYTKGETLADYLTTTHNGKIVVGIMASNSINWIITFFGVLLSNHHLVIIPKGLTSSQVRNIIKSAKVNILFTDNMYEQVNFMYKSGLGDVLWDIIDITKIHLLEKDRKMSDLYSLGHDSEFNSVGLRKETRLTVISPKKLTEVKVEYQDILITLTALEEEGLFRNSSVYIAYMSFSENYLMGLLAPLSKGIEILIPEFTGKYTQEAEIKDIQPETVLMTGRSFELFFKEFIWTSYERFERIIEETKQYWLKRLIIKHKLKKVFPKLVEVVIVNSQISATLEEYLTKIKFPYTITYGSCETSGITSYTNANKYRKGTVGRRVNNSAILLSNTAMYPLNDVVEYDKDKFIIFKHRKEDEVITEFGFEFPSFAERILKNFPFVNDCIIMSHKENPLYHPKLILFIYPEYEYLDLYKIDSEKYDRMISRYVKQLNLEAFTSQKIESVAYLPKDFERDSYGRIDKRLLNYNYLTERNLLLTEIMKDL